MYFIAFEAHVVGISFHSESFRILVKATTGQSNGFCLVKSFIFEPHQCFAFDVIKEFSDGRQEVIEELVPHFSLPDDSINSKNTQKT